MADGKNVRLIVLTVVVWAMCMCIGLTLASRKQLWNDEFYSQISTIMQPTYADIWKGQIGGDANNCPMFYTLQKLLCDATGYKVPPEWLKGGWNVDDAYSKVFLRINPVLFMSLSITLVFYYFGRFYGLWVGAYSVLVYLSSFILWGFWAEARPYALWVFLTTVQALVFLDFVRRPIFASRRWYVLIAANVFLALTVIFSVIQTAAVCALLLLLQLRHRVLNIGHFWWRYVLAGVVPVIIGAYYYTYAPKYKFWFVDGPVQLIAANFPSDRMAIVGAFVFLAVLTFILSRMRSQTAPLREVAVPAYIEVGMWYAVFTGMMVAGCWAILHVFQMHASAPNVGFQISNRYFIFLLPISTIAVTLTSYYLVKSSVRWQVKYAMIGTLAVLLVFRFWRSYELNQHFFR